MHPTRATLAGVRSAYATAPDALTSTDLAIAAVAVLTADGWTIASPTTPCDLRALVAVAAGPRVPSEVLS